MSDDLNERLTATSQRFTNSLTQLAVFTGSKIADLFDRTVDTVERTVNNITGETANASSNGSSSTASASTTRSRPSTPRRAKRTNPTKVTRKARASSTGRAGRTAITQEVQNKIREGFDRGMTTKEIAKFAGVSQSSAVRYTAGLRNK